MQGHPGGEQHSRYLIELAFLDAPSKWLDMGAGDGSTVRLLQSLGHEAHGIDLYPRGDQVSCGNFLHTDYSDSSFDGIIAQCSFYISGDVSGALKEAGRLLRKGGKLVFSDVTDNVVNLLNQCRQAGFSIRHMEDMTPEWKDYYLEALWKEDGVCLPAGKRISYVLFICERM